MTQLKIKFESFMYEQNGTAILALQCPDCGYPMSIIDPLDSISEDKGSGKIYIKIKCYRCMMESINQITKKSYLSVKKFCEGLGF